MTTRRTFIAGLGAAAAWPLATRGQQKLPVIGWLSGSSASASASLLEGFRQGLERTGYRERQNMIIEYRWAENHYDRMPALAADLVRREVAVIAATGSPSGVLAAKALTATIPIVFASGVDPVAIGLVPSLAHPGGNLTGVSFLAGELGAKKLELLHEAMPGMSTVAALSNPTNAATEGQARDMQRAAATLGVQLHILRASTYPEIELAFETLVQLRAGLVIAGDTLFTGRSEQIAALCLRHRVPAVYQFREFAAAGGLMSYGTSLTDVFRLVGVYTARVLNGEKPADLPVQQSTKVKLIINMNTAKALGINMPLSLLGRADEVIE
jgi:putative tryptophan/tyrosine transport system substrate-binding protein